MYTKLIMEKMIELAQGRFTYTPTREVSPAVIADIYSSSPIYFGLTGKGINQDQGASLDSSLPEPIDPIKKVYLLISQGEEAVALLSCIIDFPKDGVVFLAWMIVHGKHLFQGVGRANYQIFCEAVRSLGMKQIHLLLEAQNQGEITFWEGLGFKPIPGSTQKAAAYGKLGIDYYIDL